MGIFSETAEEMREEQKEKHDKEIARIERNYDSLFNRYEELAKENRQLKSILEGYGYGAN